MIPENIQRFNTFAAHLFGLLYEEFPNPCDIGPDLFFEFADKVEGKMAWGELNNQTVLSTVRWLHDVGVHSSNRILKQPIPGRHANAKGFIGTERYSRLFARRRDNGGED